MATKCSTMLLQVTYFMASNVLLLVREFYDLMLSAGIVMPADSR